jgi:hypothetical protein
MITAALAILPSIMNWYRAKQEAQMKLYQIAWEAVCIIGKFIWNNFWLVVKIIAIIYVLLQWYLAEHRADKNEADKLAVQQEYFDHKQLDALNAKYRAIELAKLAKQGKQEAAEGEAKHKAELARVLIYSKQREFKNEADKKLNDSKLAAAYDGLQLAVQRQVDREAAAERLSGDDRYRVEAGDSNATLLERLNEARTDLDVCQEAGAVCAIDYNYAKDYIHSEQRRLGVEK